MSGNGLISYLISCLYFQGVLLTGARPREIERSVLVDCFVALFRLKFDNDVFR